MLIFTLLFSFCAHAQTPNPPSLDPRVEGMYAVTLTCSSDPSGCDQYLMRTMNELSVTDSHNRFGVWVTAASDYAENGDTVSTFVEVQIGPTATEITALPGNGIGGGGGFGLPSRFSYMYLKIDPTTGAMVGEAQDDNTGAIYNLIGHPYNWLGNLRGAAEASNFSINSLVGTYSGNLNTQGLLPGTMTVMNTPANVLMGSFFSTSKSANGVPDITLNFTTVTWNSQLNLLQMNFINDRFLAEAELDLAIDPHDSSHLTGIYFTGPVTGTADFKLVNAVRP